MGSGNALGNHGQRAIVLALVLEPVLAHEHGVGVPAPLTHQGRTALWHDPGIEGRGAYLQLSRHGLQGHSAALGPPWARSCSSLARARIIRSRLRPKGGPLRCNLRQPSRRSWVDRLGNSAVSPSASAAFGFPGRVFRFPLRLRRGDDSSEGWLAEASWVGGFMRLPARRCGRPGRVPLSPKGG
jgi:hypothetical protein